jgi:hypothetical protein
MRRLLATAPLGTTFTIKWARKPAEPGNLYDVQIKRPGQTKFQNFRPGVIGPQAHFEPRAKGDYFFRGRVRATATGKASGYSPPTRITVT